MRIRTFLLLTIIMTEVVSFCLPESRINFVVLKNNTSDSIKNSLALYGEYIYQRESCNNCHTLQDGLDLKRISLDGVGGKYSDAWHYYHLWEPESLVPESAMPAFTKLYSRKIDKEKFLEICKSKWGYFTMKDTKEISTRFKKELDTIEERLKRDGIELNDTGQSEIIALIAYLQQIPTTPKKRYADSVLMEVRNSEYKKMESAWEKSLLDENSDVMRCANSSNKDTIAQGKLLFQANCFACHGKDGEGIIGPNLTDNYWLHGSSNKSILLTIKNGVPERGMKSWQEDFTPSQLGKIVAFIHSIKGTNHAIGKEAQGILE